jgi:hypothetical protein
MIKYIVKKHLNKIRNNLKHQILSLEQQLNYTSYLTPETEKDLLQTHKNAMYNINALDHVINDILKLKI